MLKNKGTIFNQFKDREVGVKDWNFGVGKIDKEYDIDVTLKLIIRNKNL